MTYIYSGVFSEDSFLGELPSDSEEFVYRKIDHPKVKTGVLFPQQAEDQVKSPNLDTVTLLKKSGLKNGIWVYYMCWGGEIEFIALANIENSEINMDSYRSYEDVTYSDLKSIFSQYQIEIEHNGYFEPFVRNYWGEYGY